MPPIPWPKRDEEREFAKDAGREFQEEVAGLVVAYYCAEVVGMEEGRLKEDLRKNGIEGVKRYVKKLQLELLNF